MTRVPFASGAEPWWQSRFYAAALILLAAVPLLAPTVPPLVDLPGHMGRYRVATGLATSPWLGDYFSYQWSLMGNLGVDLLVVPLSRLFGLEPAVKLIVIAIPMLTVAGFLAVARQVHGRLPPTAAFAVPLAYSYPFQFGFVNFALSMALAFLAFALWLRLGRRPRLRAALFVPLASLIWLCHAYGWGTLGLLVLSSEVVRHRGDGRWLRALWHAGLACLPLTVPLALMVLWREGAGGATGDWFNWQAKLQWLLSILRERYRWWDLAGVAVLFGLIFAGIREPALRYNRTLAATALALAVTFVVLPRIIFSSAYADMRLAPFAVATAILAIRSPEGWRLAKMLAIGGLLFAGARLATTTVAFANYGAAHDRQLQALSVIPSGARILSLVGMPCVPDWATDRYQHLAALAIVRRDAFVNDQWEMPGARLLSVRHRAAEPYAYDPSQMVPLPERCTDEPQVGLDETLASFPRAAFDYVWMIDIPRSRWPRDPALEPVWQNDTGIVYRIRRERGR